MDNGWPEAGHVNSIMSAQMKFMIAMKSEIRLSLDKAMSGGKKKGKGPAVPVAPKESCIVVIGNSFPAMQVQILEILSH